MQQATRIYIYFWSLFLHMSHMSLCVTLCIMVAQCISVLPLVMWWSIRSSQSCLAFAVNRSVSDLWIYHGGKTSSLRCGTWIFFYFSPRSLSNWLTLFIVACVHGYKPFTLIEHEVFVPLLLRLLIYVLIILLGYISKELKSTWTAMNFFLTIKDKSVFMYSPEYFLHKQNIYL